MDVKKRGKKEIVRERKRKIVKERERERES